MNHSLITFFLNSNHQNNKTSREVHIFTSRIMTSWTVIPSRLKLKADKPLGDKQEYLRRGTFSLHLYQDQVKGGRAEREEEQTHLSYIEISLTSVIVMFPYLEDVDLKRASGVSVQLLSQINTEDKREQKTKEKKVATTTRNNTNNIT